MANHGKFSRAQTLTSVLNFLMNCIAEKVRARVRTKRSEIIPNSEVRLERREYGTMLTDVSVTGAKVLVTSASTKKRECRRVRKKEVDQSSLRSIAQNEEGVRFHSLSVTNEVTGAKVLVTSTTATTDAGKKGINVSSGLLLISARSERSRMRDDTHPW